jgi:hypothetical protein
MAKNPRNYRNIGKCECGCTEVVRHKSNKPYENYHWHCTNCRVERNVLTVAQSHDEVRFC